MSADHEQLPSELRTPPLGLVALVGSSAVHAAVSAHLRTELRPPLHSLSVATVDTIAQLFPARKSVSSEAAQAGILRDNWVAKHRLHRPAVACVFFDRDSIHTDAGLAAVCNHLDIARASVRRRGAALVVALVGRDGAEALQEDRVAVLYRRGGLDARTLLSLVLAGDAVQASSLHRLCVALQDASQGYYKAESVRAAAKVNLRVASEVAVRSAFKAAVYCEFRQDWTSALQLYRQAYQLLLDLPGSAPGDSRRWQRWYERLLVAEQCHYKCVTLLLHTGAIGEVQQQLQRHTSHHRRALSGLPPGLQVALWGFLERQFSTCAELLMSPPANQTERPAALFLAAGNAGARRRQAWTAFTEARDGPLPPPPPAVTAGPFVGQYRQEGGISALSDQDFITWLGHGERPDEYTSRSLAMLTRAYALFKQQPAKNQRTMVALLSQMADEYMSVGDGESARRMLESAAASMRCLEGWTSLHVKVLSQMRECSRKLSMLKEHREWSLALGCITSESASVADETAAVLSAALATQSSLEDEQLLLPDSAFTWIAGFSAAVSKPGDTVRFAAALHWRAKVCRPDAKISASVTLAGGQEVLLEPAIDAKAHEWQAFQTDVVVPESGSLAATVLTVEAERCYVRWAVPSSTEVDIYAPGDALSAGAMLVLRAGGSPGLTKTAPAMAAPSATLHVKARAQLAFVGHLFAVDVTVSATDEVLSDAVLRIQQSEIAAEVLNDKGSPISGDVVLADIQPGVEVTRTFLLRWNEPCPAQTLTVQLVCHTATHGSTASLEALARLPNVCIPFSLAATFGGSFGLHSLLPETSSDASAVVLPRCEALLLSVHATTSGDLSVHSFELTPAPGWVAHALAPLTETVAVQTGDVLTMIFRVTATVEAPSNQTPGVVAIKWSPSDSTSGACDTALALPPVAVEEAPVSVRLVWPDAVVVGQPTRMGILIDNSTPLTQEIDIVVTDAPGFVFAGDRKNSITLMPRCTAELRHVFVAHTTGWQHAPEVSLALRRYGTRVNPASAQRSVCVVPSAGARM